MKNRKTATQLGWYLFCLSWIPFIGIFSYIFYPIEEWLPPISIACLIISLSMMLSGTFLLLMTAVFSASANKRIRAQGKKGKATILSIEDSGERYNDQFVLNIGLQVAPEFGPVFETVARQIVPIYHMAQVQKGHLVDVNYLPDTKEAVIAFD